MSELSPFERLAKLRALEEWLDWQLRDTRRKIEQVAEQARTTHGYVTEQERHAGNGVGVTIHIADCPRIGQAVTAISDTDARQALTRDPTFMHPCAHCRPDIALGTAKAGDS
ncbi:DUF6233 domain-containing protein [Streptomyces sp. NPDC088794]|uniref:DUF6233 domain-containing protein n=1 Tax=Streptomyces sp. NPDC088794 TaxID=3365902 RepID=UPI0037FFBC77